MKRWLVLLLGIASVMNAWCQDSIAVRLLPGLLTGTAMGTAGTVSRFSSVSTFNVPQPSSHNDNLATALQFGPLASVWVLKGFGVPTRDSWGQMAINQGLSAALTAALVYGIKGNVHATRPNGENARSFPSGHSAWAFMGATVMAHELGGTSAWYPMGGYALATGVATSRVLQRYHLPADVVAGAGMGILATEAGYALGDLIAGSPNKHFKVNSPNSNHSYLSVGMGLSLPLGRIPILGGKIKRLPALLTSLRAGLAIEDHWGMAFEAGLLSTPILINVAEDKEYVSPLNAIGLMVLPYYRHNFSRRLSIYGETGVGYYRNLNMRSLDEAVKAGNGTMAGRLTAGIAMRFTDHFGARFSVGYQLSHYRFDIKPSQTYHIVAPETMKGTSSSLLFSFSSKYQF